MKIFTISLLLLFTITAATHSQIIFQKTFGDSNLEEGTTVLPLQDGYLVTGSTTSFSFGGKDVFAMKTDLSGNELWTNIYGGPQHDEAFSTQPTQDGGFVIAGITFSYTGPSLQDISNIYLLKIDSLGNLLWSKIINSGDLDGAYSIKETADKGFIITGYTGSFASGPDNLLLVKTDSLGGTEWTRILGAATSSADIGRSVIQTRDGGYAVAGFSTAFSAVGDTSAFIVIANPAGNVVYTRHIAVIDISPSAPSPQTSAYDIIQNTNGDLVIAGSVGGLYSGVVYINYPIMLLTDSLGNYISGKKYGFNTGDNRSLSVKQTADGGYINGGFMGLHHPMLFKTDSAMTTQWAYYYGNYGPAGTISRGLGFSAALATDGGYILTGNNMVAPGYKIHLIKTDSIGQSGCNQGVPNFPGLGDPNIVNLVNGTVFSPGISTHYDITSSTATINFTDSVICISTAVNEIASAIAFLQVHPNPAIDFVNVTIENRNKSYILLELVDIAGRILYAIPSSDHFISEQISLSKLNSGIYFLRAKNADTIIATRKIIKL